MVRKSALLFLIASALTLTACNTVRGIGKDVESVGNKVQDVSN